MVAFQGYPFKTVKGLPFTYTLKIGLRGEWTRELLISRRKESKSLLGSSVLLAYRNAMEMKGRAVARPKAQLYFRYFLAVRVGKCTTRGGGKNENELAREARSR